VKSFEIIFCPVQSQCGLLIAAIACAIIALIPQTGFIGGIALRSVAVTMLGIQILHSMKNKEGKKVLLLHIFRLAAVALGLTGVALQMNYLVIGSIAAEILFQAVEAGRGAKEKDPFKALSHMSFIVIDSFVLIGMATGAWPFIVTAAAISSVVMFVLAGKVITMGVIRKDPIAIIDALCYIALGCLSIASAARAGKLYKSVPDKKHFFYRNKTDHTVTIYDKHGHVVATVEPGKTASFNVSVKDVLGGGKVTVTSGDKSSTITSSRTYFKSAVLQDPMTVKEFPNLPVGSNAVVVQDPRVRVGKSQEEQEVDLAAVTPFLNPELGPPRPCMMMRVGRPTIVIKQASTLPWGGAGYAFDLDSIRAISDHFDGWIRRETSGEDGFKDQYIVTIDVKSRTYDQLIKFFQGGTLTNLNELSESNLLELYDAADYLQIKRLRLLCQKEIATRLVNFEWNNTALFKIYLDEERSLTALLNLFDFKRG